jgi:DNA-binding response OmpR family regulator
MRPLVLAIDDNVLALSSVQIALTDGGFDVRLAISISEALTALKTITPDLILLDLQLEGENGFDLLTMLKRSARLQHVPVMMMTGSRVPENVAKAKALGSAGYMLKPFDARALTRRAAKLIEDSTVWVDDAPTESSMGKA